MTSATDDGAVQVPLPADRTAPAVARERTRTALRGWRLPTLLEPLLLVVSELVGNAVRHGRPPVAMLLRRTGSSVRVEVHDEDATAPALGAGLPADDAESGRGGYLVEAVAQDVGVDQVPGDGKVVWATVAEDAPRDLTG